MHLFNRPENYVIDNDYSILNELDQITIPTKFIYGKNDFSVPPEVGSDALRKISSTEKELSTYERSAHHPFISQGGIFVQEVKNFINQYK